MYNTNTWCTTQPHNQSLCCSWFVLIVSPLSLFFSLPPSLSLSFHFTAAPFNISLSYRNDVSAKSVTLSCSYRGSPQPQLRWLRDNTPLVEDNSSITVHISQSSFDSLLTVPLETGKVQYTFSCLVANQFGSSSRSIAISVEGLPNTQGIHNSSLSMDKAAVFTQIILILLHLCLFALWCSLVFSHLCVILHRSVNYYYEIVVYTTFHLCYFKLCSILLLCVLIKLTFMMPLD